MRKGRYKVFGIMTCVCMLLMLMMACKEKEAIPTTDRSRYAKEVMGMPCSEEGMFWFEDGLTYFIPEGTKDKTIFCFNPVCSHIPASYDNPDSECMAAGYVRSTSIGYHEGYIYYFVKGAFEHEVYRMDVNAGTRELVAELPVNVKHNKVVFDGDYAYYMVAIGEVSENSSIIDNYYELIELNLIDGSHRIVTDLGQDKLDGYSEFDVCDGTLICMGSFTSDVTDKYASTTYVYKVDLDTLAAELILSPEDSKTTAYIGQHDGEHIYYIDKESGSIGLYNINTGDKQVLLDSLEADGSILSHGTAGNGKIYYVKLVGEEYSPTHFLYDVSKDTTWDITRQCDELDIYDYNPYASVFLQYEFYEDGNGIKGFMIVDESAVIEGQ